MLFILWGKRERLPMGRMIIATMPYLLIEGERNALHLKKRMVIISQIA